MNKIFSGSLYILEDLIQGTIDDINDEEMREASNYIHYYLDSDVEIKLRNNFKLTFTKFNAGTGEIMKFFIQNKKTDQEMQHIIYLWRMLRFKITTPLEEKQPLADHIGDSIRMYANYLDGNNMFYDTTPEFVTNFINSLEEASIAIFNEGNLNYKIMDLEDKFTEKERELMYLLFNDIILVLRIFFC